MAPAARRRRAARECGVSGGQYRERQKAPPSAAGVPQKGRDVPSRHELAILRRAARGFIIATPREDAPPLYTYEDGTVIRGQSKRHDRDELREDEFRRLSQWLFATCDALFPDAPPRRWNVKKPGGSND
jgi:hypothetical protein